MRQERGFTVIEVIVAITVLAVGVLGLASTGAMVTRMIAQGQRSAVALTFAAQRLEQLRTYACATRTDSSETLYRGSTPVATNSWTYTAMGDSTWWRVRLVTQYRTVQDRTRADTLEAEILCRA